MHTRGRLTRKGVKRYEMGTTHAHAGQTLAD